MMNRSDQIRVDHARLRGYLVGCAKAASEAHRGLEEAVDELATARAAAETSLARVLWLVEQAELVARVISSGNESWQAEVAECLEGCFG